MMLIKQFLTMKKHILSFGLCLALGCTATLRAQQVWNLQQCIDYALSNNVTVRQRMVQINQQEIELNTSKNAWLPQVDLRVNQLFGFDNAAGASMDASTSMAAEGTATNVNVTASMPLFDGFKIKNQVKADKFLLSAATENLEAAKKDLAIQVATYYLQCLYYRGLADVSKHQVETSRQLVSKATIMVGEGKRPRSEQADAEAQLAADEHQLAVDEGQFTLSLLSLAQALDLPDPENFSIICDEQALGLSADTTLMASQDIYGESVASWPSIRAAEYSIQQQEAVLKVKRAGYYPTLSLSGTIGASYLNPRHTASDGFFDQMKDSRGEIIALNLNVPLFSRFQVRNGIRRTKVDILEKKLQLEDSKIRLRKDIQTAYYNADVAKQKSVSAEKSCEANRISLDYEQKRYDAGRSTIFELLQANQKYVKAQQDALQSKYEYLIRKRILDMYLSKL